MKSLLASHMCSVTKNIPSPSKRGCWRFGRWSHWGRMSSPQPVGAVEARLENSMQSFARNPPQLGIVMSVGAWLHDPVPTHRKSLEERHRFSAV